MNDLLKSIPSVNKLLNNNEIKEFPLLENTKVEIINDTIEQIRLGIFENKISVLTEDDTVKKVLDSMFNYNNHLSRVINGTGTIVHTNLGRSVLPTEVIQNIVNANMGYSNLEFDLNLGQRGQRDEFISQQVAELVGAEAACVVNNNAAAVFITLNTLFKNKKVIVSRGELVEIGGSFRIPEIMKASGAKLVEVGATNRTHFSDYENAIQEDEKILGLLKVHASNYKIEGFTSSVSINELAKLKNEKMILVEDQGSGSFINLAKYNASVQPENTVSDSIKQGVDLILFSCDKLLGGIQAGIIAGRADLIKKIKKNQLFRTFRVNKLVLSGLETLLNIYKDESRAIKTIPTLRMISEKPSEVEKRVDKFLSNISQSVLQFKKVKTEATIGGGSMPQTKLES
ncbi:hypothetical protein Zmor_011801 [Zophobas morio]|uniref:L-seryl-tRNA(Sec) selenium transferase n=1 Tax=Zophobas morio TaxID=2755281 RepID=A0AA38HJ67_9CUCU|nr:hypothetical protein Zmor_011801 [Zophobas morio]